MFDHLGLKLAKKFFASQVCFFLYLLELFLPRSSMGDQRKVIALGNISLRACLTELFLDTGKRSCFAVECSDTIYLPEERLRKRILPPR
ncbi:TPA: hypothetical protein ACIJVP_005463, partial [Klebsiella pneumoniae]